MHSDEAQAPAEEAYLIQLLLPVHDNNGKLYPDGTWESLKERLVDRYGGVTAFRRAPAEGVWAPARGQRTVEDVSIVEVMAPRLDLAWWRALRHELEACLAQDKVIIRAIRLTEI